MAPFTSIGTTGKNMWKEKQQWSNLIFKNPTFDLSTLIKGTSSGNQRLPVTLGHKHDVIFLMLQNGKDKKTCLLKREDMSISQKMFSRKGLPVQDYS